VAEPFDDAGNDCPPAVAGFSTRPTAVTAPTPPKLRKRSRLFIIISLSDSCRRQTLDHSTRRKNNEQMCG